MKYTKYFKILFLIGLSVITFCKWSTGQEKISDKTNSSQTVKDMVDSQHFVFIAQSATPLRGRFRNLTSEYDVTISKDSMISYLPYFGRAYMAPLNPSTSVLDFTSTNFSYSVTPHKKNGWDVVIKPKDNSDVQQFLFTLYDDGTANLNVTCNSRDPISFNGVHKARRKEKEKEIIIKLFLVNNSANVSL